LSTNYRPIVLYFIFEFVLGRCISDNLLSCYPQHNSVFSNYCVSYCTCCHWIFNRKHFCWAWCAIKKQAWPFCELSCVITIMVSGVFFTQVTHVRFNTWKSMKLCTWETTLLPERYCAILLLKQRLLLEWIKIVKGFLYHSFFMVNE
jgi:hypothetical protein